MSALVIGLRSRVLDDNPTSAVRARVLFAIGDVGTPTDEATADSLSISVARIGSRSWMRFMLLMLLIVDRYSFCFSRFSLI